METNTFALITQSGLIVQAVLLSLVAASIASWTIIFSKRRTVRAAQRQSKAFLDKFWHSKNFDEIQKNTENLGSAPTAQLFRAGLKELQKMNGKLVVDNVARALGRATSAEMQRLESSLSFLATVASSTPFIGLFGTVWGIMTSFQRIGQMGSASLAVVAPGISEALIATAVGLGAAIPALIAYNLFLNQIQSLSVEMDCFTQDFLNIVQRNHSAES